MSRTHTNIPKSRKANWVKPWIEEKMGLHAHMGKKRGGTKLSTGHGGINCNCCTKVPPNKLKVLVRRWERCKGREETRKLVEEDT